MRISEMVKAALSGATARLRRDAIAYAGLAVCAVAVIILLAGASVLALEPVVGPVYARLIAAGAFIVIAGAIVIALRLANQPRRPVAAVKAQAEPAPANAQFAQIAMIVEAVMLGYSLSRRPDRR